MVQAMKRTGRYKLLKADGISEDSIMMNSKNRLKHQDLRGLEKK
jgi:penicillin-binding protein 1A